MFQSGRMSVVDKFIDLKVFYGYIGINTGGAYLIGVALLYTLQEFLVVERQRTFFFFGIVVTSSSSLYVQECALR